jgi:hypothetical protein
MLISTGAHTFFIPAKTADDELVDDDAKDGP